MESYRGKRYTLIVHGNLLWNMWVYLMRYKSDDAENFGNVLACTRADGVPQQVVIVRFDGGGEFRWGNFGDLCRSRGFKQEFTTAVCPDLNGVAERALGLIETAVMAGGVHARELVPRRNCLQWSHCRPKRRTRHAMLRTAQQRPPTQPTRRRARCGMVAPPRQCFHLSSTWLL